jgi:hypothetical protein
MSSFRVGQKVVYLGGVRVGGYGDEAIPEKGGIYTVRDFANDGGIRLIEIVNPPRFYAEGRVECSFDVSRFRPLIERTVDISIFKVMLNPSRVEEVA